jgi:hypothetical protein
MTADEGRAAARRAEIRERLESFRSEPMILLERVLTEVVDPLLAECDRRSRAVEALIDRVTLVAYSIGDVVTLGRFASSVDPVRLVTAWHVDLRNALENANEALASPAPAAEDATQQNYLRNMEEREDAELRKLLDISS